MNWNHIKAVFCERFIYAEVDGRIIASNGHIALPWPHALPEGKKQLDRCGEMWRENIALPADPVVPGKLFSGYHLYRQIGTAFVDETYFRCLHDSGVTWSLGPGVDSPLRVHCDDNLLAVVMSVKTRSSELKELGWATDEEVFEVFSTPKNGYYLASEEKLLELIDDLKTEIDNNNSHIEDLEATNKEALGEIKALSGQLKKLKVTA